MSVRKLTESDKQEILALYRNPSETTSTLALRYGVSNSTISRLLKSRLSESEYEVLIQQKRAARGQSPEETSDSPAETVIPVREEVLTPEIVSLRPQESPPELPNESEARKVSSTPRTRRRSSAVMSPLGEQTEDSGTLEEVGAAPVEDLTIVSVQSVSSYNGDSTSEFTAPESLDADLADLDEEDGIDLDDDFGDGDDDEDDWEDDNPLNNRPILRGTWMKESLEDVQVLPLSKAILPKPCYLVVDARAELIARPLKDFGDLGAIPVQEVQQKTLPVFDNHRVARRFSNRTQRVIKVPDGKMLQKTSPQLQAKGITRLLIDGQVYSLAD